MGVWGRFAECFPELFETLTVLTEGHYIRGIVLPQYGQDAKRKRFRADTGIELEDRDLLVVPTRYTLRVGDTLKKDTTHYRIVSKMNYEKVGSFNIFTMERLQGPTSKQPLEIKQSEF